MPNGSVPDSTSTGYRPALKLSEMDLKDSTKVKINQVFAKHERAAEIADSLRNIGEKPNMREILEELDSKSSEDVTPKSY